MFSKISESKQQSKTCTIHSWENFASAHNHAPDMQSKPVFYSLMLKAEQGLMGVGEWWRCVCVSKMCCSKTNTSTTMTACTCLYSPHKMSRQLQSLDITDVAIAASLLKKKKKGGLQTRKYHIIHYLHKTNYLFPIELSGWWFPTAGFQGNQRHLRRLEGTLHKSVMFHSPTTRVH